ncbi:MAG TPA: hypothetical protein VGU90_00790 [Terriglobales bacterium]|nr:hypothetical protein [Terriglobales bacterium]
MAGKSMRKSKTHFEQIPVTMVEKLLEKVAPDMAKKPVADPNLTIERPAKTEPYSVRHV